MMAPAENTWRRAVRVGCTWRGACLLCMALFLAAIARFYIPPTGFSSLIAIGAKLDSHAVTALRDVPHYVYEDSWGYDGSYYVQIALHPLLDEPALAGAIDNLPYRAKRILLSWLAWGLGAGQPEWIVQAYALLNVVSWLGLATLLWRWFPPNSLDNFLRWAGVMFSHGVCMSVRDSLADGPSLLLVAVAVMLVEKGRRNAGTMLLAVATLGKETSLLAVPALLRGKKKTGWRRAIGLAVRSVLVALPLLAWMIYVRWRVGPVGDAGLGNFALPLTGWLGKWSDTVADLRRPGFSWSHLATLLAVIALTVQCAFVGLRWRPTEIWWRVGAPFAALLVLLGQPVWEGAPGAVFRVLLPLTLAFNVLVPRGRRWLPLLLVGNLSVMTGLAELSPPDQYYRLHGRHADIAALRVEMRGWHQGESKAGRCWRWSASESSLVLTNRGTTPLAVHFSGWGRAVDARRITAAFDGREVWQGALAPRVTPVDLGSVLIQPGEHVLAFTSERPGVKPSLEDRRTLSFALYDLEVAVTPAGGQSPP